MNSKKLENSIKGLVNLYTVVIGAALSVALVGVIDVNKGLQSIAIISLMLFGAFVATLFPFFHGALRHLDDAYLENASTHIKKGALIIDFTLLFLHALVFLVLSQLLKRPVDFIWVLVGVLVVDIVWGLFAIFGASSPAAANQGGKEPLSAETKWTIINTVFVALCLLFLFGSKLYPGSEVIEFNHASMILIACVFRSGVDYFWCRELYFPS